MTNDYFKLNAKDKENINKNMSNLVKKNISLKFDEIDSFKFPQDEPFGLQVNYNDTIYCLIVRFSSKNKNLICAGPGAHLRNKTLENGEPYNPPYFDRWSWYKYFDESYIAYADPMILYDDEIRVGWFVGTKNEWYLETLSLILQKLIKNQEIINENILFIGSSGGAHSSIVLATLIKHSKVLINHPQFFILNYYKAILNQLFKLLSHSFEGMAEQEIIQEIMPRLDVIELFKKENYVPFITYYLNIESEVDINNQALPFFNKIHKIKQFNGLNVVYYRKMKENPHYPLFTRRHIDIIYSYCANHLYNLNPEDTPMDYDKDLINKEKSIINLRHENDELTEKYQNILNSSSWKITSPIRKFKHFIKRMVR